MINIFNNFLIFYDWYLIEQYLINNNKKLLLSPQVSLYIVKHIFI